MSVNAPVKCKCSTLNDSDAVFCKNCGLSLPKKECSKCKFKNHFDANFCQKCGEDLRKLFIQTLGSLSEVAMLENDGKLNDEQLLKIFNEFKNEKEKLTVKKTVEAVKKATSHLLPGGVDMAFLQGPGAIEDLESCGESQHISFSDFEDCIYTLRSQLIEMNFAIGAVMEESGEEDPEIVMKMIFEKFDEDENGTIELEEMVEAVNELLGEDIPMEKTKGLFRFYDTNMDKKLDLGEFKGFLKFALPYLGIEKRKRMMEKMKEARKVEYEMVYE